MNLPNKLTLTRICIIPLMMVFLLVPVGGINPTGETICRLVAAFLFLVASVTDFFDGRIARKYNLVTDFGKFLDPLADKMLVLGALIGLTVLAGRTVVFKTVGFDTVDSVYYHLTAVLAFTVLFRELAVTSLRLAAQGAKGVVIAANILGKIKTVTQIVFVMVALLEPLLLGRVLGNIDFFRTIAQYHILSYIFMAITAVMTVWSGLNYFKAYFPIINSNK